MKQQFAAEIPAEMARNHDDAPAWTRRDTAILLAVLAVSLLLRLFRVDYRGMWTDEFHTLNAVLMPLPELVQNRLAAGHLPTYFVLLKGWIGLAGVSDLSLRLPSVFAGALAPAAFAFMAWGWLSRPALWMGFGICLLNGMLAHYSQEARMYSMLAVVTMVCHGALMRGLWHGGRRWWWIYFAALLTAASLQLLALLVLAGHAAYVWAVRHRHPLAERIVKVTAVVAPVVLLPALVVFAMVQQKFHMPDFRLSDVMTPLSRLGWLTFGQADWLPADRYISSILLGLCALTAARRAREQTRNAAPLADDAPPAAPEPKRGPARPLWLEMVRFALWATLVPVGILYALSFFLPNVVGPERYYLLFAGPMWALAAAGLWAMRPQPRLFASALGLALLLCGFVYHVTDRGTGVREAVHHIVASHPPDTPIFVGVSPTLRRAVSHYGGNDAAVVVFERELGTTGTAERMRSALDARGTSDTYGLILIYRDRKSRIEKAADSNDDVLETQEEFKYDATRVVRVRRDAAATTAPQVAL